MKSLKGAHTDRSTTPCIRPGVPTKTHNRHIAEPFDAECRPRENRRRMNMKACKESVVQVKGVRSLCWDGETLVDWVSGGNRYELDGSICRRRVNYAFDFDASIVSPSGEYAVIYTDCGTTALLLRQGKILRQLSRDFYYANAYQYPITFARLPDGREVLIHCPESYCRLEIEEIETGDRITGTLERDGPDVFHSRLSVSPGGRWLMSAGWVWHPVDVVYVYDLAEAIREPATLDKEGLSPPGAWEMSSASFSGPDAVVIGTSDEFYGDEDDSDDLRPGKNVIGMWEIGAASYSAAVSLEHPPGAIMALDDRFAICFFGHPRLIDFDQARTVHEWHEIDSGEQARSITWGKESPRIALDPQNARFAVADDECVRIVEIDLNALRS